MRTLANAYVETNKKVTFTYGGWDGTGYNGETKTQKVWVRKDGLYADKTFVVRYMACWKAWCVLEVSPCQIEGLPYTGQLEAQYVDSFLKDEMVK